MTVEVFVLVLFPISTHLLASQSSSYTVEVTLIVDLEVDVFIERKDEQKGVAV